MRKKYLQFIIRLTILSLSLGLIAYYPEPTFT